MLFRRFALTLAAIAFSATAAGADQSPTIKGKPDGAEAAFVATMQADLASRFATVEQAKRAGFFRYTNPDDTGSISYANLEWDSADVHHPSQLWYDKAGRLLGADYSELAAGTTPPSLWGVQSGRWAEFDDHVHYIGKNPKTGSATYDNYVMAADFAKAGGDVDDPQAATLVKLKKVRSVSDVWKIFDFPSVWDLIVWVVPNPKGAFSYKNPAVKP